jgi:hypothetical protein
MQSDSDCRNAWGQWTVWPSALTDFEERRKFSTSPDDEEFLLFEKTDAGR